MGDIPNPPKRAWVTLLTRESYIPGAILLAHTLRKHSSSYPLLILYTPTLHSAIIPALEREASLSNAFLHPTKLLTPASTKDTPLIAERFRDTWTKLRVFELVEYERLVFLDADMLIFKNMDELFEIQLGVGIPEEEGQWIAANHVCVCNLDRDSWAPEDWREENCAFLGSTHPSALTNSPPVPLPREGKPTHTLLNSGLFIFTPSPHLWTSILHFLNTSPLIPTFLFPDQDFLAEFFYGRWQSIGWQYNALKTWRYWHPEMWRDDEVKNCHYIVDKPWTKRVGSDGRAGYRGDDGVTHGWWWREFEGWRKEREVGKEVMVLTLMHHLVAK